jgi:D-beta-D-heptose 7-phosphate kinase/D-beta-D-heptose 1-phosphate adenosyltransferase
MNKILVIGDSCTDVFIYGDCYRLNPEAPTPVLKESYRKEYEGMAANVVNNIKALGLDCDFITQKEEIIKTRYVDEKSNYILLRIDNDNFVTPITLPESLTLSNYDLVIISDYDKGFLSEKDLQYIFKFSKLTFIDTKKAVGDWMEKATYIKINEAEYSNPKNDIDFIASNKRKFIITIGEDGVLHDRSAYRPKKKVIVRDVVGAGDSFLAAVACHYYLYKDIVQAISFANICAGEVVEQKGIAFPKQKLI